MGIDAFGDGRVIVVSGWPIVEAVLSSWLGEWWPIDGIRDPGAVSAADVGCDDVIVIGPDVDESDVLSIISEYSQRARVMVLVPDASIGSEVRWVRSGASATLHMWEFDHQVLRRVLSELREGKHVVSDEAMRRLLRTDDGWSSLTQRQREVAVMLAQGTSTHEIADHLSVSVSTVKTHVARMCRAVGAQDREELLSSLRVADDSPVDPAGVMAS